MFEPPSFVFEKNGAILQMREAVPVLVPMTVLSFEGPFNGSHSHVGSRQRASHLRLVHACVERLDVQYQGTQQFDTCEPKILRL